MASSSNANTSANANVNIVDVDMSSDIEDSGPTEKELELLRQMEEAKRIAEEEAARKAAEEEANRKAAEEEAKRKAEEAAHAAASPELWEGMGKTPAEGAEQPTAPKRVCFRCTKDGEVCEWTEGFKSCDYCRDKRRHCEVPGEPKAPPQKRKQATTVSSPKRDKGKKKARQPSLEAAENSDEETIGDLIATVEGFHMDMNADLAMGRSAASKRLYVLKAHIKAELGWRKEQHAQWKEDTVWRTEVMGVLGRIADSLEARNRTTEVAEEDGEAEGSGVTEEEKGEEEKEKEKESTAEEDAEGENDMEVAE
ncbi:hypothetical protein M405DRAFT_869975 [Rhizopogon salebrosus TDB-379]|nr:hypothetical protein M405DRAFT_869975 [Rhizopogon salebrosus TDB-379]